MKVGIRSKWPCVELECWAGKRPWGIYKAHGSLGVYLRREWMELSCRRGYSKTTETYWILLIIGPVRLKWAAGPCAPIFLSPIDVLEATP
jgi:hypothetical protein